MKRDKDEDNDHHIPRFMSRRISDDRPCQPDGKAKPCFAFLPEDIRTVAKGHPNPPKWQQMIAHILLGMFLLTFIGGILFLGFIVKMLWGKYKSCGAEFAHTASIIC